MNIFVVDYNPVKAAQMLCDKHVVKMPLETAQILCSAFDVNIAPYRRTHYNHPCCIWARKSAPNYNWLIEHGIALCEEFRYRYGKEHASLAVILWCRSHQEMIEFPWKKKTRYALCFDRCYQVGNAVLSYRYYYCQEKRLIAKWERGRSRPFWF